ncbi:hypothetical protein [Undibacterium pigrum]|nr:hypothetical protein [Undibacterium pigrum]
MNKFVMQAVTSLLLVTVVEQPHQASRSLVGLVSARFQKIIIQDNR